MLLKKSLSLKLKNKDGITKDIELLIINNSSFIKKTTDGIL